MSTTQLKINTSFVGQAGPSSRSASYSRRPSPASKSAGALLSAGTLSGRPRTPSSASSSSSSLDLISPAPSSAATNASSSSSHLPIASTSKSMEPSSPALEDSNQFSADFVLAMHDYIPGNQNATCLSFRAGQIIRVFNRDSTGWWDGELDGKRGWFPSNYVSENVNSLTEEVLPYTSRVRTGHAHTVSAISATSWASTPSPRHSSGFARLDDSPPNGDADAFDEQGAETYCPSVMVPLLHALSLLQNAVRADRVSHFQPSTACIISCVRNILCSTECLSRDAPVLRRYPILAQARKGLLSDLAALVAQSKKASEDTDDEDARDIDIENMLRLAGQVFANVRRFLSLAVQCGVEVPESRSSQDGTPTHGSERARSQEPPLADLNHGRRDRSPKRMGAGHTPAAVKAKSGIHGRAKSLSNLRAPRKSSEEENEPLVPVPHGTRSPKAIKFRSASRERTPAGHRGGGLSISSISSDSSSLSFSTSSSRETLETPTTPPFPSGPSTATEVMEVLKFTHNQYLSTIAAFVGQSHSHSRSSHASSTGHMYDLARDIVEMVCKMLTILEAVMQHPELSPHKQTNLRAAKDGLYKVTWSFAESVRLLTATVPPTMSEEGERAALQRSATDALKAGADCVTAIKMCVSRWPRERPFVVQLANPGDVMFTPIRHAQSTLSGARMRPVQPSALHALYSSQGVEDDQDLTIQAQSPIATPMPKRIIQTEPTVVEDDDAQEDQDVYLRQSSEDEGLHPLRPSQSELDLRSKSPVSMAPTDEDGTTWEGSLRSHEQGKSAEDKLLHGELPAIPVEGIPQYMRGDPVTWMLSHDYAMDDVAYNSEGHLVGATLAALVEKMTPHDSIVDQAFSAVFFLTFRLFCSPPALVEAVIARYNLLPPPNLTEEDLYVWQQRKGIPVRLRVSNFLKSWLDFYWRPAADNEVLPSLAAFTRDALAVMFPGPSQRILELITARRQANDATLSPKGDRVRDAGMLLSPPSGPPAEIPRPIMTKALLAALRNKTFSAVAITDFDALELARQFTIMECTLFCSILPEDVMEMGQEGAPCPPTVKAVTSLSTMITGWVSESILNELDTKKRTMLVKFFVKLADRCLGLNNFSTSRSILAALDSSTISRLHQTWLGVPQKQKLQLEALRKMADHSRNYHEYRSRLRNTPPPAVPFLGLYLTDLTFCREGNPSHRASPVAPNKKLLNFNKYHKLARIVQDMQRFQAPYNLKAITEVQEYLQVAFELSRTKNDLQDLYRRSLLVEPKRAADTPLTDIRHIFSWTNRSAPPATGSL